MGPRQSASQADEPAGSRHTELVALLEDRTALLHNQTTDHLELKRLDIASVHAIQEEHADGDPLPRRPSEELRGPGEVDSDELKHAGQVPVRLEVQSELEE